MLTGAARARAAGRPRRQRPRSGPRPGHHRRLLLALLAAAAAAVLLSGPAGVVVAVVAAGVAWRWQGAAAARPDERRAVEVERVLPLLLDLIAAAVASGGEPLAASTAVRALLPGVAADELARALAGPGPVAARAAAVPGERPAAPAEAALHRTAASAAQCLLRGTQSGSRVAADLRQGAADLRQARSARGTQAAQRAGVLVVGPLGACFLPAFVAVAVVPVVLTLASSAVRP